jgi:hypothetical protein
VRANGAVLRAEIKISEPFMCHRARDYLCTYATRLRHNQPEIIGAIVDRLAQCLPNSGHLVLRSAHTFCTGRCQISSMPACRSCLLAAVPAPWPSALQAEAATIPKPLGARTLRRPRSRRSAHPRKDRSGAERQD